MTFENRERVKIDRQRIGKIRCASENDYENHLAGVKT